MTGVGRGGDGVGRVGDSGENGRWYYYADSCLGILKARILQKYIP